MLLVSLLSISWNLDQVVITFWKRNVDVTAIGRLEARRYYHMSVEQRAESGNLEAKSGNLESREW